MCVGGVWGGGGKGSERVNGREREREQESEILKIEKLEGGIAGVVRGSMILRQGS